MVNAGVSVFLKRWVKFTRPSPLASQVTGFLEMCLTKHLIVIVVVLGPRYKEEGEPTACEHVSLPAPESTDRSDKKAMGSK